MKNWQFLLFAGSMVVLAGPASAQTTLTIATVGNPDMERMQKLSVDFTDKHPDITLDWVVLDENTLRQRVTTDIATGVGRFDVVSIGNYEAPIWAGRGWLAPLDDLPEGYDVDDLLPTIRQSLSLDGKLYAVPFYGESSFTMYRTDLFQEAGLVMPEAPTWDFIESAALKIGGAHEDVYGICLRGKPGWGENMALITAMANSYGGRWFDIGWRPQFDSEPWTEAVTDYVHLLTDFGPPEAAANGYAENLQLFREGKCAIWVDATVAASTISDPATSSVAGKVGFAMAPGTGLAKQSNWLWTWALAVSAASEHQDAARDFVAWATSKDYAVLAATADGWVNVPPGTRLSLYENPNYLAAAPFAGLVRRSIESADPAQPTVDQVPYTGIQFVAIPEFTGMATAVGTRFAEALRGNIPVPEALANAQWLATKVIEQSRFMAEN